MRRNFRHGFRKWRTARRVVWALCAVALSPFPTQSAQADVRIGGDSNGYYTVRVMSWWDIPFRTVVRQHYDFSCGSAAIATLLTYHYKRPTDERLPFQAMWKQGDQETIRKVGFSMLDMKHYLNGIGLRSEGFRFDANELRKIDRPAIALLNLKGYLHFVVIKGVSNDKVLVGDSTLGIHEYSVTEFMKYWNGILLAIVDPKITERPVFNAASDWGPWSRAPLDPNVPSHSIGTITTSLPPVYQITPQALQLDHCCGQGG